jgi:hypothetical protein
MRDAICIFFDSVQQMWQMEFRFVLRGIHLIFLVLLCISKGRPFDVAIVKPFTVRHDDAAMHIKAVNVRCRVKRLQDRRMIIIVQVIGVDFSVVANDLAVHVEARELTPKNLPYHLLYF